MVSFDTAAFIALIGALVVAVLLNREKLSFSRLGIFYVAMYRGKTGIALMDRLAREYRSFWRAVTWPMIVVGFAGMALVVFDLGRSLVMVLSGASTPSVGVVAPFKAKGVFYVPFFYWIISIFVILIIHEGMHGVMARVYKLPVKNSGLMVLGVLVPLIPGAFVEPDEKKLTRAKRKHQLAVYSAGPVANIVTGVFLMALLSFAITPLTDSFYSKDGVVITGLMDGNPPAELAGLSEGEKITMINGVSISSTKEFSQAFKGAHPGDTFNLVTSRAVYDVTLGENPQNKRAWLGVYVDQPLRVKNWAVSSALWVKDLIFWLALLSLGVGLFNLVPLGPIDGGRMFLTVLESIHPNKMQAAKIWKSVSFLVLGVLLTNVVLAFL
ncbi:PDZ domain-containing protein [Candidatus Woesearchaeota archaeon]|nr:MAG: PDZ domain-containing protein [Candidatus Woesearchaeota archaeon]